MGGGAARTRFLRCVRLRRTPVEMTGKGERQGNYSGVRAQIHSKAHTRQKQASPAVEMTEKGAGETVKHGSKTKLQTKDVRAPESNHVCELKKALIGLCGKKRVKVYIAMLFFCRY